MKEPIFNASLTIEATPEEAEALNKSSSTVDEETRQTFRHALEMQEILCSDGSAVSIKHTDLGSMSADENSSESTIYYLGDTMTRNGMKITLTGARQTEYVSKDSYTYYEPSDGKVFVILFFDIKNASDQTQRFNALNTFDVFIDDYSDRFTSFLYTAVDDMEDLNDQDYKDILSGKSMSGYKVIEAPSNWKKIELTTRQGAFLIESKDFV